MTTATAKPACETSVLDRVLNDRQSLHQAAEQILWNADPDEPILTSREREILKEVGIVDHNDIVRELGRVATVKRWMQAAGSPRELLAAEKAEREAAREQVQKRPAIEEQITKLQAERDALIQARERAARRLADLQTARDRLRDPRLMPSYIRNAYEHECHAIDLRHHQKITEIETELNQIAGLERIDMNTQAGVRQAVLHCQTAYPDGITQRNGLRYVDAGTWREYVNRRAAKRSQLEDRLAKLKAERSREKNELDHMDFYIRQLENTPKRS
jgi:hypothetical protein